MKILVKLIILCLSMSSTGAFAALIDGTLAIGGAYDANGGVGLGDATDVSIDTVYANDATGDFLLDIPAISGVGSGGSASLSLFVPVSNFISIGGWTLDISTLSILDQNDSTLNMSGTGTLSKDGLDATNANWSFSSQSVTSYSMTVATVVPVPAAVWLFGAGLLGLIGIARRKA